MDTKGRLIAGSHNRNEFVLINADEIGRVSAVRNLIFLLVWLPSLKLSSFSGFLAVENCPKTFTHSWEFWTTFRGFSRCPSCSFSFSVLYLRF